MNFFDAQFEKKPENAYHSKERLKSAKSLDATNPHVNVDSIENSRNIFRLMF